MTPFMKVDPKWIKAASARLPSSAKLIDALYRVIQQPDVDVDHVVRLVSMDTAITSRLLRMANSACYTRGEQVTSLDQALSWLGAFQAYRVACITVTAKLCEQNLPIYRISADRLLELGALKQRTESGGWAGKREYHKSVPKRASVAPAVTTAETSEDV